MLFQTLLTGAASPCLEQELTLYTISWMAWPSHLFSVLVLRISFPFECVLDYCVSMCVHAPQYWMAWHCAHIASTHAYETMYSTRKEIHSSMIILIMQPMACTCSEGYSCVCVCLPVSPPIYDHSTTTGYRAAIPAGSEQREREKQAKKPNWATACLDQLLSVQRTVEALSY